MDIILYCGFESGLVETVETGLKVCGVCVMQVSTDLACDTEYTYIHVCTFPIRLLNSNQMSSIVNKPFRNLPRLVQL